MRSPWATGTGTFICELLEHFRGQPAKLAHKYHEELHANEVAILPYYVANLNIEATYAAITGKYEEYKNLCFVDTLDNVGLHTAALGSTGDLFGSVSEENVARIKRQNGRRISVVIGNPPYNANQANENDNNKNREYPEIDGRIKQTYIAESTAQKTKLYDMYARFFRWASDRLAADGVLAFVTNRSFVESRTFDGFRKTVAAEFSEIYVVDLGGDVRANTKLSGTKHNVFGIQTGVAISFFVKREADTKKKQKPPCRVFYVRRPEMEMAEEKLAWLGSTRASALDFEELRPDSNGNWLNVEENDFHLFLPIASKDTKAATTARAERSIFKSYSLGISTNRDEWLYDPSKDQLQEKIKVLSAGYNSHLPSPKKYNINVKWSETLKRRAARNETEDFDASRIVRASYRPYFSPYLYKSNLFIDRPGLSAEIFPICKENMAICFSDVGSRTNYVALAVKGVADLHFGSSIDAYQQVPLYRYDETGQRIDNITDWGIDQFKKHYQPGRGKKARPITREGIFHYVYAVLHDPLYRETYAQNLKREFPRIPLHGDSDTVFWRWADWGAALMALHIGYESQKPWELIRRDVADEKARAVKQSPKPMLRSDPATGTVTIDSETTLSGIPPEAWNYVLGSRSAIDWVLDQHKEKTPKDPTIRAKFDTYRLADHKETLVTLLGQVVRVSVETMRIVEAIRKEPR